jgi:drug/metabolite transporter (DMT)-like permease
MPKMKPSRIIAFLFLCLSASSGWIWDQALPPQLGTLAAQGLHFLLIGLVVAAWSLIRRNPLPQGVAIGWITLAGLVLFAAPILLLHAAHGMVSSALGVLVFALLPVAVMVMTGALKGLLPALLGVAGVLVLLPVSMPEGRGLLGIGLMVLAMLLTAAALVWLHRLLPQSSRGWAVVAICLSNGLILSLAGRDETSWGWEAARCEALRALIIDAPEVLLLIWLIAALEPRQLSARWLVAPLFTVLGGYVLMRPEGGLRLLVGAVLLALGGGLVFADNAEVERGLDSLGLGRT